MEKKGSPGTAPTREIWVMARSLKPTRSNLLEPGRFLAALDLDSLNVWVHNPGLGHSHTLPDRSGASDNWHPEPSNSKTYSLSASQEEDIL
jgi:hypothetical protein